MGTNDNNNKRNLLTTHASHYLIGKRNTNGNANRKNQLDFVVVKSFNHKEIR